MIVEQLKSLATLNTFHIQAFAKYFIAIKNELDLLDVLDSKVAKENKLFILGGGSNVLLTQDIDGLLILNQMKGIKKIYEDDEKVFVNFRAGENWHDCVCWCIDQNLGGIENLSFIPGTIGAAPIQNIGAYGIELKDVFVELSAIHIETKKKQIFSRSDCAFGYRNSVFKNKEKGNYIISDVTLQLSKKHVFHTSYGNIQQELEKSGNEKLSIKAISDAVIRIRKSKLPDPTFIGNAGSFFKNPVVSLQDFTNLKQRFPEMPHYEQYDGIKIPAAWLIEYCHPENASSWKGYREKNYGVHEKQALCLVNYGGASGEEILDLSTRIITTVQHEFNIALEREVNIW